MLKRTFSSGSDDERSNYKKQKCQSFMEGISSSSTCSSPDYMERPDPNHNIRKKIPQEPRETNILKGNKEERIIPSNDTVTNQSLQKFRAALQKNWTMLKEKMDPTVLATKLYARGIFDEKALETIKKCLSRQEKNDTLIQELCTIETDTTNVCVDLDTFVSLLKETGQKDVVSQLDMTSSPKTGLLYQDVPPDEHHNLMTFVKQNKNMLLEEVDPRIFLDKVVEIGCMSSEEKLEIAATPKRRERVKLVLQKIESSNKTYATQITKCLTNAYPKLYSTFKHQEQNKRSGRQDTYNIEKGSKLILKIAIQDTREHDDPMTTLQKKKRKVEEIERRIIHNLGEDQNQLSDMIEQCVIGIDEIKFGCVKIYLTALTSNSLIKLKAYAESRAFKKLIASLIGQNANELDSETEIVLEIKKGCTEFTTKNKVECLCNVDKERVAYLVLLEKEIRCSLLVIDRFIKSNLIDEWNKASLINMKSICDSKIRSKKLLRFLLNEKLPKVFFCILEEEILRIHGSSIIRRIMKEKMAGNEVAETDTLTNSDIRDNRALLLEELEVHWLSSILQNKMEILVKMNETGSREEKLERCLNYLESKNDISWFAKELKKNNKHLYDTLQIRKEASCGKSEYFALGFNRLESALQFYFEDMIEEIDPRIIAKWLGAKSQTKLKVQRLLNISERSKRAECFCMSLIGAEPYIVYDVLQAMKTCGYEDIVCDITKLARKGPLCRRYRCPNVTNLETSVESCVYKKTFNLIDITREEGKVQSEIDEEDVEEEVECFTPFINFKLTRKGRVSSFIGGSESDIFSGSGPNSEETNTDYDSDNDKKTSDIEKKQRIKEWMD